MKYWLVVGIHDLRFKELARTSLRTLQGTPGVATEPLIVETGSCEFEGSLKEPVRGVVPFLQRAWEFLSLHAGKDDWFVRVDADDYYGPTYLERIDALRQEGWDATGISDPFVVTEDGTLYACETRRPGTGAFGGTLAGRILSCPEFRGTPDAWGEDSQWVEDALWNEVKFAFRGSEDYAWRRWDGARHTFPVLGHEIPHVFPWNSVSLGKFSPEKVEKLSEEEKSAPPVDWERARAAMSRLHQASLSRGIGRA